MAQQFWRSRGIAQVGQQFWRRPATSAAAFTPADLPDLVAWYDATTGVYSDAGSTAANDNDTVQQWNDQSGNGAHLKQATAGNRPAYKTTAAVNGNPSLLFTLSGSDWMASDASSVPITATNAHSCFAVLQTVSAIAYQRLASYIADGQTSDATNTESVAWLLTAGGGNGKLQSYANNGERGTATTVSNGTPYRIGTVFDGTNCTIYNNTTGTTPTAYTQTLGTPGRIFFGIDPLGGNQFYDGYISEIVICKDDLTAQELSDLDSYFVSKWGF